jgi:hypothetical protein
VVTRIVRSFRSYVNGTLAVTALPALAELIAPVETPPRADRSQYVRAPVAAVSSGTP